MAHKTPIKLVSINNFAGARLEDTGPLAQHRQQEIRLELIQISPFQPRLSIDPQELAELATSLREAGQSEAILVRPLADRYELISGHRRVTAARTLGWDSIKAQVIACDENQARLMVWSANQGRKDLSDFERGLMYKSALESGVAKNQTHAAQLFASSQAAVSQCMAMHALPADILSMLHDRPRLLGRNAAARLALVLQQHQYNEQVVSAACALLQRLADGELQEKDVCTLLQSAMRSKRREQVQIMPPFTLKSSQGRELAVMQMSKDGQGIKICLNDGEDAALLYQKLTAFLPEIFEKK